MHLSELADGEQRCAIVVAGTLKAIMAMHKLYTADNPFEAHLLCGYLVAHGVSAQVQGDVLFSMRGELPMGMDTLPSVWLLHAGEQERGELLLEEWRNNNSASTDSDDNWQCAQCGEESEGGFAACWQCGSMRA